MIGFGRWKVWFERDDDGDTSVGFCFFGLKVSHTFFRKKPEPDPVEPSE